MHREQQGPHTLLTLPARPDELLNPTAHLTVAVLKIGFFCGALITGLIVAADFASGYTPSEGVIACPVLFYLWRWTRGISRRLFKTQDQIRWDTRHLASGSAAPPLALDEVTSLTVRPIDAIPLHTLLRKLGILGHIAAFHCKPLRWFFLSDTPAEPYLRQLANSGALIAHTGQREQVLAWGHGVVWLEQLAEALSNDQPDRSPIPVSIETETLSAA